MRSLLAPDLSSEEVTSLLALALRRRRDKKVPPAHLMRLVVTGYIAKEGESYNPTPIGNYVALGLTRRDAD